MPTFALIYNENYNNKPNPGKSDETWQCISDAKKEDFLICLEEKVSEIDLAEHPEKILGSLTDATIAAVDSCFPPKKLSNRAKKRKMTPWLSNEIYEGEKKQSRLFRKCVKTQKPEDHQEYKAFRQKLSKQKYKAKRAYYRNLLSEANIKENRTAIWDVINKAFGKKRKCRVYPESTPTTGSKAKTNDSKNIPNALNKHFTDIAKKLADNLKTTNTCFTSYMGSENKYSMYLHEIKLDEIIEEILKICTKKAMGYDRIPPKIVF